jgi:hypothetical protein
MKATNSLTKGCQDADLTRDGHPAWARARRRATDALLIQVSAEQVIKLEQLLVFDPSVIMAACCAAAWPIGCRAVQ